MEKTLKMLLSQTVKARAFMYHVGMYHHLVALYQNTSNYGPGVEISPMLWVLGFNIEIKKDFFKNLLVPNRKGYNFHIWHVSSSSGPLPKYFKLWPWGGN